MNQCFGERLARAVQAVGAPAALGLDPHLDRYPARLRARFAGRTGAEGRAAAAAAIEEFDREVIHRAAGRVAAVKLQHAFYERLGAPGYAALEAAVALARARGLLVILDGKRGDISSTAAAYAEAALHPDGPLGADALTVNPWMGFDTLEPFVALAEQHGRGIFALVRTTNPGSADLQRHGDPPAAHKVAAELARLAPRARGSSGLSSFGAVVGAQVPAEEQRALRALMPDAWFLVPGMGAQGGSAAEALAGRRADGMGSLAVAARSVLFPSQEDSSYEEDFGSWISERISRFVALLANPDLAQRSDGGPAKPLLPGGERV